MATPSLQPLPPLLDKKNISGLYWGTFLGTIWFVVTVTGVYFKLNIPGHDLTAQMTMAWVAIMSLYTGNKSVNKKRENRWGRSLGWFTIGYGFVLFFLHIFFLPNTVIPEALYWGMGGVSVNLGGWEFAQTRQTLKNENGARKNGHQNNISPTP